MSFFNSGPVHLETERLIIRDFTDEDIAACNEMDADPDVVRFIGGVKPGEKASISLQQTIERYSESDLGIWAVIFKQDMKIIGYAGLKYLPGTTDIEILYRSQKQYWGMGLAAEASMAVINYAFGSLNINRIVAVANPENTPSIEVLENLGMKFTGDARHYDVDVKMYSISNPNPSRGYIF